MDIKILKNIAIPPNLTIGIEWDFLLLGLSNKLLSSPNLFIIGTNLNDVKKLNKIIGNIIKLILK